MTLERKSEVVNFFEGNCTYLKLKLAKSKNKIESNYMLFESPSSAPKTNTIIAKPKHNLVDNGLEATLVGNMIAI